MMIAQQLYEGIELPGEDGPVGLITYMRTDSTRVSEQALEEVRGVIKDRFGDEYVPEKPNVFKRRPTLRMRTKHSPHLDAAATPESVRTYRPPTSILCIVSSGTGSWRRRCRPRVFDETTVDIAAGDYLFRVKGLRAEIQWLDGVYGQQPGETDRNAPRHPCRSRLRPNQTTRTRQAACCPRRGGRAARAEDAATRTKFTQPPPRFSEATLVKELEENGIGRPSTYASILGTLQDRDYVVKNEGRFKPTYLGFIITDILTRNFDDILAVEYTAKMEEQLDDIEHGRADYEGTLKSFYKKFKKDLGKFEADDYKGQGKATDEKCEKCGSPMVIKVGRFGPVMALTVRLRSDNEHQRARNPGSTESEGEDELEPCENCGKPMVLKRGRSDSSWPCHGVSRLARRHAMLIATKVPGSEAATPIRFSTKVPALHFELVSSTAGSASSPRARISECSKYVKLSPPA